MAAINEGNMLEPMAASPSPRQKTRLPLAEDVVAHSNDHYGQMVELPPVIRFKPFSNEGGAPLVTKSNCKWGINLTKSLRYSTGRLWQRVIGRFFDDLYGLTRWTLRIQWRTEQLSVI
jgi:hypothetical protein